MLAQPSSVDFLQGGGEMGALTRAYDWTNSPLGPPETWPQSLRVTVRLLLNTRHPMFIWWGPDLIQFYNDAYAGTMGPERHPAALGGKGRECWAEIWEIIGPQIDYVMSGHGSTWDEERLVPVTRNGAREDVWWTYGYSPIDLDDGVGGVLVVCNDVTRQHNAKKALEDYSGRLEQLFEQAPGFIAALSGPDHVYELTNAAYRQMVGPRDFLGRSVRDVLPEVTGHGFFDLLDTVYRTGIAHVGRRMPITFCPGAGRPQKRVFVDFVYQPIRDGEGTVTGIFVQGSDVTDLDDAERALRDKEIQLVLALEAAEIGVWECMIGEDGFVDLKEDDRAMRLLNRYPGEQATFEAFAARVHPEDRLALKEAARAALDPEGDGFMHVEYRILPRPGMKARWVSAKAKLTSFGGIRKFVGTVRDISDAKEAEARQEILRGELQHRIKNLIAMVGAIATQTLRGDDIAERRETFNARLQVLAQAQDMLMANPPQSAAIHDTIRAALAPHDGTMSRFTID
ncbi:HWE histidine kinase domain-containing protein, partial [Rhizobium sp.]|uniref:HWE histidine kinase domain-containing protein n=1 Tax=Rhizobium sp. TaxID=391 RepID=UPI000E9A6B22|nr:hypothetical protein [Rhizobium sp.]